MNNQIASAWRPFNSKLCLGTFGLVYFVLHFHASLSPKLFRIHPLIKLLLISFLVADYILGCYPENLIMDLHQTVNKRFCHFRACEVHFFFFEFDGPHQLSTQQHFCRCKPCSYTWIAPNCLQCRKENWDIPIAWEFVSLKTLFSAPRITLFLKTKILR